jgi:hypothetical protein
MVMGPTGLENKNDCAGKGQQQFLNPGAIKHRNTRERLHYWKLYPNNEYVKI